MRKKKKKKTKIKGEQETEKKKFFVFTKCTLFVFICCLEIVGTVKGKFKHALFGPFFSSFFFPAVFGI